MSSGFVSETELAEQRRRRQEEWEKVRTADQPVEAPEETYDPRSLYERLEEQRRKKDEEYEEAHKLKNMVRGLDDDEVEFLDSVERIKETAEKKVRLEERKEMDDFRNAVASLAERSLEERLQQEISKPMLPSKPVSTNRKSQVKLLAGAVVRKRSSNEPSPQPKRHQSDPQGSEKEEEKQSGAYKIQESGVSDKSIANEPTEVKQIGTMPSTLKCIGILPGMGSYPDSSDSELSSESDSELPAPSRFDLLGRSNEMVRQIKLQQQQRQQGN